jgi:NADH-quinone oxidoreductase subunit F
MERPLTKHIRPDREQLSLKDYEKAGGYQSVRKALAMSPQDVQNIVKASNLRGRGGAGFPTGAKWSFVPMGKDAPRPKYLVVNADEMEPGTFKDRMLLEGDPHQIIEGVITSAYAIEAQQAFIFIRWAYKLAARRLEAAIAEAYEHNYLGKNILGSGFNLDLRIHTSAGRYICGEETALLNALEGKRATPRAKPPFPQVCGLFGKPTIVNNAETIANIPHIVNNGPDWFKSLSKSPDGGTKLYGVSGRVRKPGAWELPMGVTIRELLEEHAGGMLDGYEFSGVIPGVDSTDFIVA